jgi:hypothetical protein
LNLRPSGYEPDELPDCSTPHRKSRAFYPAGQLKQAVSAAPSDPYGFWSFSIILRYAGRSMTRCA